MATIHVNDEARDLADLCTIDDLVKLLKLEGRPLAVELNERVVPRRMHPDTPLKDGDRIEIVTLVGGG